MQHEPKPRHETNEVEEAVQKPPLRSLSQRAMTAWRDVRDARGVGATVIKVALVLVLGWLLAGAIQQLVIIALVIGALWLIFDVIRRNIFR
ncbi:MAG: hypothetical protein RML95_09210 [Anaerolineae bacterium]|nr:hypothetical protein [Anaerolineae bacterium]MDW8299503.1 hypothetical protein [Anaerolineae bacterium]